ncbi:MAG: thioredoxin [Erysipelotrichaceae bacterium]
MLVHGNDKDFNELINKDEKVLVDFFATWCGPCKMLSPVLDQLGNEGMNIVKMDVDENPDSAQAFQVMSIPTLILFKNGKAVKRHEGYMAKPQIEDFYKD